eukprot:CAMPEP_0172185930 /NCGR_PEP_ID=MMETSP1050-20130122/20448_1 /TAXON_ID=233186 /ORGANISM="Cryptomonas curvata, Strain CCAP979/52" /LENGTH=177 /DNA_ID=CAMNT_0012859981 /DNA_START=40 /DNA_END=571 /DNA_ORIENTATION=-
MTVTRCRRNLATSIITVTFLVWNSVLKTKAQDVDATRRSLNAWRFLHNISISSSAVRGEKVEHSGMHIADVSFYTDEATFYECSLEVRMKYDACQGRFEAETEAEWTQLQAASPLRFPHPTGGGGGKAGAFFSAGAAVGAMRCGEMDAVGMPRSWWGVRATDAAEAVQDESFHAGGG